MSEWHSSRIDIIGNTGGNNVGINNGTINNATHHYGDQKSLKQLAEDTDANKGKRRHAGTCEWLLRTPDYQTWSRMESQYSVLWIHGHMGCGKTTLMSRVIQDVRDINKTSDSQEERRTVHLLHYYMDFPTKEQQEQFYREMLMTFWEQTKDIEWSSSIFGSNATDNEIQEKLNLLLATTQSDVYIVIDALDQLHERGRRKVLKELNFLVKKHKENGGQCRLAIMISSRDLTGYDQLQGYKQLEFRIQPHHSANDIKDYLDEALDSNEFDKYPAIKTEVLTKLTKEADGMFLWATLQAKNFSEATLKSSITANLENLRLPGEMSQIYQEYAEGFESLKDDDERQIAVRTIALLSQERESIPKNILLTAVSLRTADGRINPEIFGDLDGEPSKIIPICNHLIELDENLGIVRFCHLSIFEFFQNHRRDINHRRIAELSLAHLCSSEFSGGPDKDATWYNYGNLRLILQKHPFLEYASCNWAISMRKSVERESLEREGEDRERKEGEREKKEKEKREEKKQEREKRESEKIESAEMKIEESEESEESESESESEENESTQQRSLAQSDLRESHSEILTLLKKLFETSGKKSKQNLQLSFQVHSLSLGKLMPAGVCHDHIVSYFALHEFFNIFHEKQWLDVTRLDEEGSTAIHWAIRNETERNDRRKETVQRLIEYGTNIDAGDKRGCTPLYYASLYGNLGVVELLLERGADLNIQNKENETALIAACKEHHHKVIKRLLAAGANVRVQGSGGTALQAVSLVGCHTCVKRILDQFVNDTLSRRLRNIIKSFSTILNVWFKRSKNMAGRSGKGLIVEGNGPVGTALHAAAFYGHLLVVKLLCDRHFDVRTTHDTYGSVLTAAVLGCEPDMSTKIFSKICEKLIHRGIDVNDTSGVLGPALHAAAFHGHSEIVQLLLDNGAKVYLAEGQRGTAYQAAHERDHEDIKKLLLMKDNKADTYGKSDMEELLKARQIFHRALFTIALKAGNMITINGLIPQYVKLVKSEIDRGKSPFLKTLANVGKECFNDIIKLATMASAKAEAEVNRLNTHLQLEEDGSARKRRHKNTSKELRTRIRDMISTLSCTGRAEEEGGETSGDSILASVPAAPSGLISESVGSASVSTPLRRQTTALEKDTLTGRFPEVINALTEAAMKILEYAISKGDTQKIKIVADTWVDALNNLILCDGFGEPMLRKVAQARADMIKIHLCNTEIDAEERYKNAENIVRAGFELLLSAAARARGPGFKLLSFTISTLCIGTLNEAADDAVENQSIVLQLTRTKLSRFSKTISTPKDPVNGRIIGQVVLEFIKAASLCTQRQWMDEFKKEWVRLWTRAFEAQMGDMINELVKGGLDDYKTCVKSKRYDEALSVALASISLLRVAIEQRSISVVQTLLEAIESGFIWSKEPERSYTYEQGEGQQLDVGRIFDAIASLFATTPKSSHSLLHTFAMKVLESMKPISEDDLQASNSEIRLVYQRVQAAERKALTPELQAQHRLQLMHVSMAIAYLLDTAHQEKAGPNIILTLEKLAMVVDGGKLD